MPPIRSRVTRLLCQGCGERFGATYRLHPGELVHHCGSRRIVADEQPVQTVEPWDGDDTDVEPDEWPIGEVRPSLVAPVPAHTDAPAITGRRTAAADEVYLADSNMEPVRYPGRGIDEAGSYGFLWPRAEAESAVASHRQDPTWRYPAWSVINPDAMRIVWGPMNVLPDNQNGYRFVLVGEGHRRQAQDEDAAAWFVVRVERFLDGPVTSPGQQSYGPYSLIEAQDRLASLLRGEPGGWTIISIPGRTEAHRRQAGDNPFPQSYADRYAECDRQLRSGEVGRCWCGQHYPDEEARAIREGPSGTNLGHRRQAGTKEDLFWQQYDQVTEALRPYVFQIDGQDFIKPDAPADLVRIKREMDAMVPFMGGTYGHRRQALTLDLHPELSNHLVEESGFYIMRGSTPADGPYPTAMEAADSMTSGRVKGTGVRYLSAGAWSGPNQPFLPDMFERERLQVPTPKEPDVNPDWESRAKYPPPRRVSLAPEPGGVGWSY